MAKGPRRRGRRRKKSRRPWAWVLAAVFALAAAALVTLGTRHAEPRGTGLMSGPAPAASRSTPQGQAASQAQQPAEQSSGDLQAEAESEKRADGPSKDTDQQAAEYFRTHWNDKAAKRLKEIRSVGGYLRIYTDLPESAHNSAEAVTLCERGLEYLRQEGVEEPVVFVQAEYGDNGNPVLANIIGPSDTNCRITDPDPG